MTTVDICMKHGAHRSLSELALYADQHGMTAAGAAKAAFPDATAEEIGQAERTLQRWTTEIMHRARRLNDELAPNAPADVTKAMPKQTTKSKPRGPAVRATIFDYSATAVIRWMGKNGWSFEDAGVALNTLGAGKIADTTIRIQLAAGKKGERGDPAPLTASQAKALKKASK